MKIKKNHVGQLINTHLVNTQEINKNCFNQFINSDKVNKNYFDLFINSFKVNENLFYQYICIKYYFQKKRFGSKYP